MLCWLNVFFFFKHETAYEMRISDWSSDVCSSDLAEQVEVQAKYAGYIERQQVEIDRVRRYEDARLPLDLDYVAVSGLSNEVRAKLAEYRPETVARSEEEKSELQSPMRNSYAVFGMKTIKNKIRQKTYSQ